MTKFKSGDKAEFIERYGGYKIGDVVEIIDVVLGGAIVNAKGKQGIFPIHSDSLKLVEPKPSKNQRITALEKEVAELRSLKEKVEHLEQAVQQYFTVPGEPSTMEDKEKTPNQQRKEIIEKAKAFVKENVKIFIGYEFVISDNEVKLYSRKKYEEYKLHTAKCNPSDVFNEHIGKAIALGRALNLDVSEFENAVKPNRFVKGQIVDVISTLDCNKSYLIGEVTKVESQSRLLFEKQKTSYICDVGMFFPGCAVNVPKGSRILNDTNAIYGGGE